MKEDREWTLNNVEQVCVDTKDVDEICFGLEQLTIFATENIQNFSTTILKLNSENKSLQSQLKAKEEVIKEAREYIKEHTDLEPYNEDGEGGELILCDYDVANVLEILSKGENK